MAVLNKTIDRKIKITVRIFFCFFIYYGGFQDSFLHISFAKRSRTNHTKDLDIPGP